MKIHMKKPGEERFSSVQVEGSITAEELKRRYVGKTDYPIVGAKKNGSMIHLTTLLKNGDNIEFLDMREPVMTFIYQRTVIFVFLKATFDVIGATDVKICNSISMGVFAEIDKTVENIDIFVPKIKRRMEQLIKEDLPIEKLNMSTRKAINYLEKFQSEEKKSMVRKSSKVEGPAMYSIDDYVDFYYDFMMPSTGYIYAFDLISYDNGVLLRYPRNFCPDVLPNMRNDRQLLQAFREADRWENIVGINYVDDLNRAIENETMKEVVQLCEALHEKRIIEIAEDISAKGKRIILIAGPTSSGKTSFAHRLAIQLRVNGLKPIALSTDDYFIDRDKMKTDENGKRDFEDLSAVDTELFNRQLNSLLKGEIVDVPVYNFVTGVKEFGRRAMSLEKNQPVIIEGIHGLNSRLTEGTDDNLKYKIYISPIAGLNVDRHNIVSVADIRMIRRMVRDNRKRGRVAADTIREWPDVKAGESRNIFPYMECADSFFNSALIYEISVLKKKAMQLLEDVPHTSSEYAEAERLMKFLRLFDSYKDEKIIPNNSIIREFLGNSVFFE